MGAKKTYDFEKIVGKATWVPGFVAFAVFAGLVGIGAYSSLSNQISADTASTAKTPTPSAAKVAGSDCAAVFDQDASGKNQESGFIKVAINNYWVASGVASASQHKAYNEKTSNSSYKCNEISVKVPNAAKCLTDEKNLEAIKKAVTEQYKLDYVNSTTEFEKLTGDQMKKTVIGSSSKAKCLGGSDSYEMLNDEKQAEGAKKVEAAQGKAEGVLSGGEDVKTTAQKTSVQIAREVAQGQEGTKKTTSKTTKSDGATNATADEPGLSGVKNAMLPDIHKGEWHGNTGDNLYKYFSDGQKASVWYSKQGNPYLSIKGKDGKYYRAPIKIDKDGNATETGDWEAYSAKGGTRVKTKGGGKVGAGSAKAITAQKAKSEATAKSVPDAKAATTGKIYSGGWGTVSNGSIIKKIEGQPHATMIKDNSTGKYYWSMRNKGEYFRAAVSVSADGSYKTVGGFERYDYNRKVHRLVKSNNPNKVTK